MSPTQQQKAKASVPRPRTPEGAQGTATEETATREPQEKRGGLTLPVVHARVPLPSILPPASSTRGRILWYGGLGAVAVFGAVDWPVVVAIAAGTWVAEQSARERVHEELAAGADGD